MSVADLPIALTPEEVAEHFRVQPDLVYAAIKARRLPVVTIGTEVRILKEHLLSSAFGGVGPSYDRADDGSGAVLGPGASLIEEVQSAPKFWYNWPAEKGKQSREEFPVAYRTRVRLSDGEIIPILIGITEREAAGKPDRKRVLVMVNGVPMVEFAGADDFQVSRLVAGIIKPDGHSQRHLREGEPLPPAYSSFDTRRFNEIVCGPHASRGMAIVCKIDDFTTMVRHALIRWTVKKAARG